jgi:Tfp pilus assembly protein PilO
MINKIPKEKRSKVILVWVVTLMVVSAWAFVVLSWQLDAKHQASQNLEKRQGQFVGMTNKLNQAEVIQQDLAEAQQALSALEAHMVTGDPYSWALDALSKFKQGYDIDLPQFGQPVVTENTLLPKFPYRQVALTVAGTAYFHDLGMFVADFENRFPFARIINLDVAPNATTTASEREKEKLSFKMDVVFLVKPNQP